MSLEIAELTGKQHKHLMEAIRKMEPAWKKVCKSNFRFTSLEIAEETGKPHNDVLKAIRKMEQAWVNVTQGKFSLRRKAGRDSSNITTLLFDKFFRFYLEVTQKDSIFAPRKSFSYDKGVRNKGREEGCFQALCRSPQGLGRPHFWQDVV